MNELLACASSMPSCQLMFHRIYRTSQNGPFVEATFVH